MRSAARRRRSPASVRETPRASRRNSGTPSRSSSRLIWMLTADWVRWSAAAPRVTLPWRATARKVRSRSLSSAAEEFISFMVPFKTINWNYVFCTHKIKPETIRAGVLGP